MRRHLMVGPAVPLSSRKPFGFPFGRSFDEARLASTSLPDVSLLVANFGQYFGASADVLQERAATAPSARQASARALVLGAREG